MIITKTPFRISFVGGGSDISSFYNHYPGAVLSTTINKYMYITSHRFFDEDKLRIKYSKTETVGNVNNIKHPIVKEIFKKFNIKGALELTSHGDVPAGTGLGSSSSFTVGVLHNLYALSGQLVTKDSLAEEACDIEINKVGSPIGKQDQYAAAFGGLNIIRFNSNGDVNVAPIHLKESIYKKLEENLVIFYTGKKRDASSILKKQKSNLESDSKKVETLKEMVDLVPKMRDVLYQGELRRFGELLHQNWLLKQQLVPTIGNNFINNLYDKALKNGAIGGKILGAGGGGFLLLYCEKKNLKKLRNSMFPLKELKFCFENEGSKLIYIDNEYEK